MSVVEHEHERRMAHLAKANSVRTRRSQLKREITSGRRNSWDVIRSTPEHWLETMAVWDLLITQPHMGKTRLPVILRQAQVSPFRPFGRLTHGERERLAVLMERWERGRLSGRRTGRGESR